MKSWLLNILKTDLPMDTDLNTLDHYPSVWIGKEEFEEKTDYEA